ncbi:hypothetical protein GCM10010191_27010 [Actinomadura vinacea]|uniref:Pyridoxamine 5'-phosphate oxidase N-terminal domain-containing protein n=1 Tax=Actinomadura vinacea TaxID=115336 RepID=A0ABN3IVV1_9ACTN
METLAKQRTVRLTTYKRDGTPVGTAVNIVVSGELAYFRTYDKAWKSKRLHNNPHVTVAHSTFRGEATGPSVRGRTRLLSKAESKPIRRLLARKHPIQQGLVVPLTHKLLRYETLHYELVLENVGAGSAPQ